MVAADPESFADLDGHTPGEGPPVCATHDSAPQSCQEQRRLDEKTTEIQTQNQAAAQAQEKKEDKPKEGGVKAPPPGKPNVPPPPGKGPNGEPNEWEKIPGTDGQKYGPEYKPKYPVPGLPGGSQPKLWWDSPDGQWSHEPATGEPRGHFDWRGNKINSQAVAKAATAVGTAVVLYKVVRVLVILAEAAAAL
jgi:hypothetical protein